MKHLSKALILLATLSLSSCININVNGGGTIIGPSGNEESFTSSSWETSNSGWVSDLDGFTYNSLKHAVGVNNTSNGAGATSSFTYTNVSSIEFKYSTTTTSGAGNISVTIGNNSFGTVALTKSGGATPRSATISKTGSTSFDGNIKFTVNCVTNTLYIHSIKVIAESSTPTTPTSIELSKNELSIAPGGSKTLSVSLLPRYAIQYKEINWASSNASVASVDANGKVTISKTATAGQTAIVTASLKAKSSIKANCAITVADTGVDDGSYTILLYVCGADLESEHKLATSDITEILSVKNQPANVNIVMETGGAKSWSTKYGISANKLERYEARNGKLNKISSLTKASMGKQATFESFLKWGLETYPASKTSVIFWNHGGAMTGCCFDENYNDGLTPIECHNAFTNVRNQLNITEKWEWVGYDCCLMQVQDIALFNSQYFNYMVAAEESEAGEGWDYDTWLDDLYRGEDTETVLSNICDGFVQSYSKAYPGYANDQTLSALDLSKMAEYKVAFDSFASSMKSAISSSSKKEAFANLLNKKVKSYGGDYYEESDYEYLVEEYGYHEDWFDKEWDSSSQSYYYYAHGWLFFGTFDALDMFNKLYSSSDFSSIKATVDACRNALKKMVIHNTAGNEAGESHGLCVFVPLFRYYGADVDYSSKDTLFTSWTNIF